MLRGQTPEKTAAQLDFRFNKKEFLMRPIDYFLRSASLSPEAIFLKDQFSEYTYRSAENMMRDISRAMIKIGLQPNDSVAVYSPNTADAVICIFGALMAGASWVPINIRNGVDTNIEYMEYVSTKWLFFHSGLEIELKTRQQKINYLNKAICIDKTLDEYISLKEFCEEIDESDIPDFSDPFGAPDAVFSRWPTGGTTGPSKGVEMKNSNIVTMFELGLKHYVGEDDKNIVHLAVAPITHAAGLLVGIFSACNGLNIVHENFNAKQVLFEIQRSKVTHIFLPPTAFYDLISAAKDNNFDTSSLRQILIAAAPVATAKLKQGVEVFGPVISQCYGQAEAPMLISMLPSNDIAQAIKGEKPNRLSSCGKVTSCTEVAILDDSGSRKSIYEKGEICVRGPLVTPGYFKKAEATNEVRTFGWHHTGDIGYLDEDNYLYIIDRKKDMIITGGFNVFATEIEEPILEIAGVLECAVVGLPDEKWGESVTAVVRLEENSTLLEEDILSVIKPKLGGYKTPKKIIIWPSIPKTAVGKIDKKLIRHQLT